MTAMGVASPSAQGQAIIKTATAELNANGHRGSGPKINQTANVRSDIEENGRNKPFRNPVRDSLHRRLRTLRFRDKVDDLSQQGIIPDAFGSKQKTA